MRTIWKTPLASTGPNLVDVPVGARPLAAAMQGGAAALWWQVESDAAMEQRTVHVVGTGWPLPEGLDHVATILADEGRLIWHVFAAPSRAAAASSAPTV